jgi:ethanolamine ammonia-lyase large subunit
MTNLPYKRKNTPPQPKTNHTPKQTSNGLLSSVADGISFGIGTSIGSNIINNISNVFSKKDDNKCINILKEFDDCKKNYVLIKEEWVNDACLDFYEKYKECLIK